MDDFPGLLARDFGFKPQGKSAPMAPPRNANNNSSSSGFGLGSDFSKSSSLKSTSGAMFDDYDRDDGHLFNDVFGGPPKYSSTSAVDSHGGAAFDYDSIFKDSQSNSSNVAKSQTPKSSSMPVYDKPVYDDDIFEGLPGVKRSSTPSTAAASKFDDVFASISESPPRQRRARERESSPFDDLLGNLGKKETATRAKPEKETASAFDDLLPGFGRSSSPSSNRSTSESNRFQKPTSSSTKTASSVLDDPFVVLESTSNPVGSSSGVFPDPLGEIGNLGGSRSLGVNGSSVSGEVFDDLDPLDSLGKSVPPVSTEVNKRGKDRSPLRTGSMGTARSHHSKESTDGFPMEDSERLSRNRTTADNFSGSHENPFDMPSVSMDSRRSAARATSPPSYTSASPSEASQVNSTPKSEEIFESSDDVWLTVSEIPLFTQPTSAPPPSRPPPPRPKRVSRSEAGSFSSGNARKKVNEVSSVSDSNQYSHSPRSARATARSSVASQIDELEEFAMGMTQNNVNEFAEVPSGDNVESSAAAAAAAKEAMDRAEAKFRHAKEMRERESLKAARNKESVQLDRDERSAQDSQERELRQERQHREREEEEREQRRLERERERAREIEREREEKEREQRRLEKERERAREIEERERARQAVERATREARERAATEARLRAERAAVDKANAAARERAERVAVQRAQAEARERAAAEAKDRAEKAAAEARERANSEARDRAAALARAEAEVRLRAERAAVERAAREARERASVEARERAAAAARANQNQNQTKNDNDLESFFSMGSRPSSAPRPRANSSDPIFDAQSKGGPEVGRRTSVGASANMKKASSTTNIVDDLTSIFGASTSQAGEFQAVEGETEERRRARLERHQRTQQRAAKALAEKNERDLQVQREQAERHRIAETLDAEIKRWAAGKEGNLRALLATLQYVLWPECGWQPVSLTDLITGASVKKVYRKATLCIHPDKVQQKGANLQQKYIAEKVFDLLKEAWNKFNSEELF